MMLAISKKNRQENVVDRLTFTIFEIESIQAVVDVAKRFNDLLDLMNRYIEIEEDY